MTFVDSLLVSLFCMFIVFVVLISLYLLIQLFSKALGNIRLNGKGAVQQSPAVMQPALQAPLAAPGADVSAGELRLKGVDEKTAAMIMAIVSDESGIPLAELQFKSIRAIDESQN